MTKRDLVLSLAKDRIPGPVTPAAFFLHFPPSHRRGRAAVEKHVEYFRATGNDIAKIQFEFDYPRQPEIEQPADWVKVHRHGADYFADQLDVVGGVVDELKSEAIVVITLYSAFMFAHQAVGQELLAVHLEDDPIAVTRGFEIITESMLVFIRGCLERGVDGFYASSQGGETGRFTKPDIFDEYVRPYEKRIWDEIDAKALVNILHVCDYEMPYRNLDRFVDYPGEIVSAPLELTESKLTGAEVEQMFDRPFLGGMERLGPLSTGPKQAVEAEAQAALASGGPCMILGADCTLAADADWENIAAATAVAHRGGAVFT